MEENVNFSPGDRVFLERKGKKNELSLAYVEYAGRTDPRTFITRDPTTSGYSYIAEVVKVIKKELYAVKIIAEATYILFPEHKFYILHHPSYTPAWYEGALKDGFQPTWRLILVEGKGGEKELRSLARKFLTESREYLKSVGFNPTLYGGWERQPSKGEKVISHSLLGDWSVPEGCDVTKFIQKFGEPDIIRPYTPPAPSSSSSAESGSHWSGASDWLSYQSEGYDNLTDW